MDQQATRAAAKNKSSRSNKKNNLSEKESNATTPANDSTIMGGEDQLQNAEQATHKKIEEMSKGKYLQR